MDFCDGVVCVDRLNLSIQDFTRLLDEWEVEQWNWMTTFKVDRLIYKVVQL